MIFSALSDIKFRIKLSTKLNWDKRVCVRRMLWCVYGKFGKEIFQFFDLLSYTSNISLYFWITNNLSSIYNIFKYCIKCVWRYKYISDNNFTCCPGVIISKIKTTIPSHSLIISGDRHPNSKSDHFFCRRYFRCTE